MTAAGHEGHNTDQNQLTTGYDHEDLASLHLVDVLLDSDDVQFKEKLSKWGTTSVYDAMYIKRFSPIYSAALPTFNQLWQMSIKAEHYMKDGHWTHKNFFVPTAAPLGVGGTGPTANS